MKKKVLITAMLAMLVSGALLATMTELPPQISKFIEAWNANSYVIAKQVLSPSYAIKGVPKEYTEQVLQQAFGGHGVKIDILEYLGSEKHHFGIQHKVLAKRGEVEREMTFVIDNKGDICESNIFQAEVKQVRQEKTEALGEYISMDFELHESMILIDGELEGEKVQFLLDSGAPIFVLNSHFADAENRISASLALGVGGAVNTMDAKRISHLSWPGGEYRDIDVVSMDLSSLEEKLGKPFAGLLSFAELEPYEVHIDYAKQKIYLYGLDPEGNILKGGKLPKAKRQMPFEMEAHIAVLPCRIGDLDIPLGLDTGAQSNLLDLPYYEALGDLISKVETDTLMGADARMIEIKSAELKSTHVSGKKYGKMRYAFSDISHMRKAYKMNSAGLLGYPFLSQRPFSLNYRKRVLSIY
jgi:hypothetical protein